MKYKLHCFSANFANSDHRMAISLSNCNDVSVLDQHPHDFASSLQTMSSQPFFLLQQISAHFAFLVGSQRSLSLRMKSLQQQKAVWSSSAITPKQPTYFVEAWRMKLAFPPDSRQAIHLQQLVVHLVEAEQKSSRDTVLVVDPHVQVEQSPVGQLPPQVLELTWSTKSKMKTSLRQFMLLSRQKYNINKYNLAQQSTNMSDTQQISIPFVLFLILILFELAHSVVQMIEKISRDSKFERATSLIFPLQMKYDDSRSTNVKICVLNLYLAINILVFNFCKYSDLKGSRTNPYTATSLPPILPKPAYNKSLTMTLRRNYDQLTGEAAVSKGLAEASKQEYEILLEFDLKREKEKNLILEQRLRNKEMFIQQMKHFQEELTAAYEQCKNELVLAQQKIEYLQNVEFREYTEQIADLKHMLLSKNNQESKRDSLSREERPAFTSLTHRNHKNKQERRLPSKNSDRRDSKTASNVATGRERSEDKIDEELRKDFRKASNFITHFLQMAQFYVNDVKVEEKMTKKLKKSWKWIKDVVKEWDQLRVSVKTHQHFKAELARLFKLNNDVENSILLELIRNLEVASID